MRPRKYSEAKIKQILDQVANGTSVPDTCAQFKISKQTLYRWRAETRVVAAGSLKTLVELQAENMILKEALADAVVEVRQLQKMKHSTRDH